MDKMNIISDCLICGEHSLHILGQGEKHQTEQCINCGYVTSEKFKLNGKKKQQHKEYKKLTEDMKKWCKVENDKLWIPTLMTLPIGMIYPQDIDNLVAHASEMKWLFAEMVEIPESDKEKYPVEGKKDTFYERRVDTDNAKIYDTFLEAMNYVNKRMKDLSNVIKGDKPKPGMKLPKLKKVK